jgi:hypothetical protein
MSDPDRDSKIEGYKEAFRGAAQKHGDDVARNNARTLIDVFASEDAKEFGNVLEAIEDLRDENPPERGGR